MALLTTRTFRVFVSSTFEDLQEERNALQSRVFPQLRRLCESRGARFQAIDLRWGVSAEAGLDQQTLPLCLEEIGRCRLISPRPNFLVLLGDRYGWRPLPVGIPATDFEALINEIVTAEDRQLLSEWYRRDDNSVPPEYVLQSRLVGVAEGASSAEKAAAEQAEEEAWRATETRLRAILADAASATRLTSPSLELIHASATEQEILTGALNPDVDDAADHVLAFVRSLDDLPVDRRAARFRDFDGDEVDTDARARVEDLKTRLRDRLGANVYEYRARWTPSGITKSHIDSLCDTALDRLAQIIENELSRLEHDDELAAEATAHHTWAEARRYAFTGRADLCDSILDYLRGDATAPLAVVGCAGSGKSAVMAEIAARAAAEFPAAVVVARFVGATPQSLVGSELLANLCRTVGSAYGSDAPVPDDYSRLVTVFRERLALPTRERPLLLFIDGVDQLPAGDPALQLGWLPTTLPPHVRIVISRSEAVAGDDTEASQAIIEIPPATEGEAAAMLDRWLTDAGRTITEGQREAVLAGLARCPLPAYLHLAFEDARTWHSYDPPRSLGDSTRALTQEVIERLSRDANHGATLVEHGLAHLAAARYGLSEDEMIELLSAEAEVMADFRRRSPRSPAVTTLPVAVWARFRGDLEPYLTEFNAPGATVLRFHDRQFEDTVRDAFLGDSQRRWHSRIAEYFKARPAPTDDDGEDAVDLRRLSELPYQLAHAGRGDELTDLLTDPEFLAAKVDAMGVPALLGDFSEVRALGLARADLSVVEDALMLAAHVISDDPQQLAAQLLARLRPSDHERVERLRAGLLQTGNAPLIPVRGALTKGGEALRRTLVGHRNRVRRVAFLRDDDRVVSSSNDGTDRVWDVATGTVIRVVDNSADTSHLWADLPSATQSPVDPAGRWSVAVNYSDIVLSTDSGSRTFTLQGHNKAVDSVAFSPDGKYLVSGGDDHTVKIWDLERVDSLVPAPHPGGLVGVATVGEEALSAGRDGTIKRWSLETGDETHSWEVSAPAVAFGASGGGGRTAVAGGDGRLYILNAAAGDLAAVNEPHGGVVTGLAISRDGRRAATTCDDGVLRFWDLDERKLIATVEGPTIRHPALAVSEDGQLCACAYGDFATRVWDVDRAAIQATCIGHRGPVNGVGFAARGRQIVSASDDHTVRLWDAVAGFEQASLYGHWHWVRALASNGGDRAVSVSEDYTVRVWDLATAAERFSLAGRQVDPFGAPSKAPGEGRTGFSPSGAGGVALDFSGRRAVSFFNNDDTLRLWDLNDGSQLGAFTCDQILSRCALSADGTQIVAGTVQGEVIILRTPDRLRQLDEDRKESRFGRV